MIVSFETAKKLHTAGFPQPEAQYHQAWYDENGVLSIIITGEDYQYFAGAVFAPTATDIMSELTPLCFLMKDSPANGRIFWRVQIEPKKGVIEHITEKRENPAEACALAWLERHCEPIKIPVHTITCMTDSSLSVGTAE